MTNLKSWISTKSWNIFLFGFTHCIRRPVLSGLLTSSGIGYSLQFRKKLRSFGLSASLLYRRHLAYCRFLLLFDVGFSSKPLNSKCFRWNLSTWLPMRILGPGLFSLNNKIPLAGKFASLSWVAPYSIL